MKEIWKTIKKNYKDLIAFLVFFGAGYYLCFVLLTVFNVYYFSKYEQPSICTSVVRLSVGKENMYREIDYQTRDLINLTNCSFSPSEKLVGVDKVFSQDLPTYEKILKNILLSNYLRDFRIDLSENYYTKEFSLLDYKSTLEKIVGQEETGDLVSAKDMQLYALKRALDAKDENDILARNIQYKLKKQDPDFLKNFEALNKQLDYELYDNTSFYMYEILVLFLVILIIMLLSRFFGKYKIYVIYFYSGLVFSSVFMAILLISDLI